MNKDPFIFIRHVRDCIGNIESFSRNVSKDDFLRNKEKQSAIVRQLEIIGEAVKGLPAEFTKKYPAVPWSDIAGMRDKLIHHYFEVDLDKVWNVVKIDLPTLKKTILDILHQH